MFHLHPSVRCTWIGIFTLHFVLWPCRGFLFLRRSIYYSLPAHIHVPHKPNPTLYIETATVVISISLRCGNFVMFRRKRRHYDGVNGKKMNVGGCARGGFRSLVWTPDRQKILVGGEVVDGEDVLRGEAGRGIGRALIS